MIHIEKMMPFFFMSVLFLLTSVPVHGLSGKPEIPPQVPGQVMVSFYEHVTRDEIENLLMVEKCELINYLKRSDIYLVRIPGDMEVDDMIKKLRKYPEVKLVEPNYKVLLQEQ